MGDREKSALFNSLSGDISGARVADVFAGSGALGIEALSRGAACVDFVDNSRQAARTIRENLETLGAADDTKVYEMGASSFVDLGKKYDIVFADPPYHKPQYSSIARLASLLDKNGLLVVSQPAGDGVVEIDGLEVMSSKVYAGARISILRVII